MESPERLTILFAVCQLLWKSTEKGWSALLQIAAQACGLDVHDVHEFFVSLTSGQPAESVEIEDFIHHAMRPGSIWAGLQLRHFWIHVDIHLRLRIHLLHKERHQRKHLMCVISMFDPAKVWGFAAMLRAFRWSLLPLKWCGCNPRLGSGKWELHGIAHINFQLCCSLVLLHTCFEICALP